MHLHEYLDRLEGDLGTHNISKAESKEDTYAQKSDKCKENYHREGRPHRALGRPSTASPGVPSSPA